MRPKIERIRVVAEVDDCPDTSFLGEYTDDLEPGVIVRVFNEFYEKLPRDTALPERGREYRGFKPYAGGEKVGTPEYYKYGMQDHERMRGLEIGDWYFVGIVAKAEVSYDTGLGYLRLEEFSSSGLWGIESDSGAHLEEVKQDELDDLRGHLEVFGVSLERWEELTDGIEITWE